MSYVYYELVLQKKLQRFLNTHRASLQIASQHQIPFCVCAEGRGQWVKLGGQWVWLV